MLAIRRSLIHVRIAHDLLEEAIVLAIGPSGARASHEAREHGIELALDRAQLTKKSSLLDRDLSDLHHVLFVSFLDLNRLILDLLNFSK